jgi:hypothetical protein
VRAHILGRQPFCNFQAHLGNFDLFGERDQVEKLAEHHLDIAVRLLRKRE